MTPDGSIIVGGSGSPCADAAFIWDAIHGTRDLQSVLESDYGLDLTGWQLREATGISDNGLTIVGTGCNPDGDTEAWIATLTELCPADIDGDGLVGIADFLAVLGAWGPNPGHPADITGDGTVGIEDFIFVLGAWGGCP